MDVTFEENTAAVAEEKEAVGVRFYASADGQRVECLISEEALHFLEQKNAIENDALEDDAADGDTLDKRASFTKHKEQIETVARTMIESGFVTAAGTLLLLEGDFT